MVFVARTNERRLGEISAFSSRAPHLDDDDDDDDDDDVTWRPLTTSLGHWPRRENGDSSTDTRYSHTKELRMSHVRPATPYETYDIIWSLTCC